MNLKFWEKKKATETKVTFSITDTNDVIDLCEHWDLYLSESNHKLENRFRFWNKVRQIIDLTGFERVSQPEIRATRILIHAYKKVAN